MKRSRQFVEWHRQATEAQDPDRPNLEEDLEAAVEELANGRAGEPGGDDRANPYKDKKGKFTFKPAGAIDAAPPAAGLSSRLADRPLGAGELRDLQDGGGSASAHLIKGKDGKVRFTKERAELHSKIIGGTLKGATPQKKPRYNIMGGGPASGKSTMEKATPSLAQNSALINADEYKLALPEYGEKGMGGAAFTHEESSYLVARATEEAFRLKVNVTLDGTGDSSVEKMRGKINAARDGGYSVHGHYVSIPTDMAVDRAMARAQKSGRLVPEFIIRDTHKQVSGTLPKVIDDYDSLTLWDNSGSSLQKVLDKPLGGKVEILDAALWAEFMAKADE